MKRLFLLPHLAGIVMHGPKNIRSTSDDSKITEQQVLSEITRVLTQEEETQADLISDVKLFLNEFQPSRHTPESTITVSGLNDALFTTDQSCSSIHFSAHAQSNLFYKTPALRFLLGYINLQLENNPNEPVTMIANRFMKSTFCFVREPNGEIKGTYQRSAFERRSTK